MKSKLLAFFLSLIFTACASYQSQVSGPREMLKRGQISEALEKFKALAEKPSDDQLVYLMEYATALQIAGQYKASSEIFIQADKLVDVRMAAPFRGDANDTLYQWDASRDYNPAPKLERIQAALLAINAADDERNPPETGLMVQALQRVKGGRLLLIPASEATTGHGTTGQARFWQAELRRLLQDAPRLAP